jgi:hypothetical protein
MVNVQPRRYRPVFSFVGNTVRQLHRSCASAHAFRSIAIDAPQLPDPAWSLISTVFLHPPWVLQSLRSRFHRLSINQKAMNRPNPGRML